MKHAFSFMHGKTYAALLFIALTGLGSLTTNAQTAVVQSFNGTNNNTDTELGYDGNPTIVRGNARSGGTNGPTGQMVVGSPYYAPTTNGSISSWGVSGTTEGVLFRGRQTAEGSTGNYIEFRIAAWGLSSSEGLDDNDQVDVFVSVNNGLSYNNTLRVVGKRAGGGGNTGGGNNNYWNFADNNPQNLLQRVSYAASPNPSIIGPTNQTGTGQANRNQNEEGFSNFHIDLPDGAQYIRFYIIAKCDADELWTIDEVKLGSNSSAPLPVELKSFTAAASVKGTQLQWATASEKNNAAFEVQRGSTAEQFQTVGRVSGQGTSSQGHSYSWVDKQPLPGLSYYRLRQIDYDGTESFSPVAVVQQPTDLPVTSFFPNPSTGFVTLVPVLGDVEYRVINALGQSVLSGKANGGSTVNMQSLRAGSYFLELQSATGRTIERFLRE